MPLIACILLLQGCTFLGMVYNNAERLIVWQVDRYLDLSRAQKRALRRSLEAHLDWHRTEELPRYVDLLRHVQTQLTEGTTAAGWRTAVRLYEQARDRLLERLSDDAAQLMASLEPAQVAHLRRVLAEENDELRTELQASLESEERGTERMRRLKEWYGSFSEPQVVALAAIYNMDEQSHPLRYRLERREQLQQGLLDQLERGTTAAELKVWWAQWYARWQSRPGSRRWQEQLEDRILAMEDILMPHQRVHAARKLQRYIDIMIDLSPPERPLAADVGGPL